MRTTAQKNKGKIGKYKALQTRAKAPISSKTKARAARFQVQRERHKGEVSERLLFSSDDIDAIPSLNIIDSSLINSTKLSYIGSHYLLRVDQIVERFRSGADLMLVITSGWLITS